MNNFWLCNFLISKNLACCRILPSSLSVLLPLVCASGNKLLYLSLCIFFSILCTGPYRACCLSESHSLLFKFAYPGKRSSWEALSICPNIQPIVQFLYRIFEWCVSVSLILIFLLRLFRCGLVFKKLRYSRIGCRFDSCRNGRLLPKWAFVLLFPNQFSKWSLLLCTLISSLVNSWTASKRSYTECNCLVANIFVKDKERRLCLCTWICS